MRLPRHSAGPGGGIVKFLNNFGRWSERDAIRSGEKAGSVSHATTGQSPGQWSLPRRIYDALQRDKDCWLWLLRLSKFAAHALKLAATQFERARWWTGAAAGMYRRIDTLSHLSKDDVKR
jgi:hypothetical protein